MTRRENVILVVASRWLTPLAALFAFMQLASWPPGVGVGFIAGLAMVMPVAFNALLFGVQSILAAISGAIMRVGLTLGLIVAFVAAGLPGARWSAQLIEAGAFAATASASTLILLALMGRAGALRETTW
jgi:hypothetical protein